MNEEIKKKINTLRFNIIKNILDVAYNAGSKSAHIGGALSLVDIFSVLYSNFAKYKINSPQWEHRDRLILSKGHSCLVYYSLLFELGYINKDQLYSFEQDDTFLPGHPVKNVDFGIDFSTGSLGMGLSLGVGLCIAFKKRGLDNKTFVFLGDGECNEGSIWEALLSAKKYKLDNLYVVIDKNNFQQTGPNSEIMDLGDLKNKLISFGWDCKEIDGHNILEINDAFQKFKRNNIPKVIIANTIKGKSISFTENNNLWHHNILTKKFYDSAIQELKDGYKKN